MGNKFFREIFKKGSKTYFTSSLFFPKKIKDDIFVLYAFARKADNFVDSIPQDKEGFEKFTKDFFSAAKGIPSQDLVISSFVSLKNKKQFEDCWIEAFLESMRMDTHKTSYETKEDLDKYIYGSAEVIGLMMSKIMGLKEEAVPPARLLGKAMQHINFIRDIKEDIFLGRTYFTRESIKKHNLCTLSFSEAINNKENFRAFIREQISGYNALVKEAEKGFKFIPKRELIAIKTASDMYKWTARTIEKNPLIVYRKKVKPSFFRIILSAISNAIKIYLGALK